MWQIDGEGRFSLDPGEFTHLIGARAAAGFGRQWSEIAASRRARSRSAASLKAIATRDSWSGVTLNWPVDGGAALPVELSGLPIYDRGRNFAGYRGFGVCADLDGLARLASRRDESRDESLVGAATPATLAPVMVQPNSGHIVAGDIVNDSRAADLPAADVASSSLTRIARADGFGDFTANRFGNARGNAQERRCRFGRSANRNRRS